MEMKRATIAVITVILLSFIIATYSYYHISGNWIASHWNLNGDADDHMSKFWGLFLLPTISLGTYVLFLLIPKFDPLKENIEKFKKYYETFVLILILFFFYIFLLTTIYNFGVKFNMTEMIIPAVGVLFFYIGTLLKNLKRNWFIGIRTPWTLSNDQVWAKTHALGSILFEITGIIMIIGIFFGKYILWFVLTPIVITTLWLTIYSYIKYKTIKIK
jgi:uncharacterized membrane protein